MRLQQHWNPLRPAAWRIHFEDHAAGDPPRWGRGCGFPV